MMSSLVHDIQKNTSSSRPGGCPIKSIITKLVSFSVRLTSSQSFS